MSTLSTLITVSLLISIINGQTSQQCVAQLECTLQDISADEIDCIGMDSCEGASLSSSNRKTGYIQCSGFLSCNSYRINKNQYPSILTASNNVYCSGNNACWKVGAISAKNIYCTGQAGCSSDLDSPVLGPFIADKNIYCTGTGGCSGGDWQIGKKAFCGARHGCSDARITGGL